MPKSNTITGAKGITFSGETFIVPQTHDMVKTLFDPSIRKSLCEILIVSILFSNGLIFYFIQDNQLRIEIFIGLYLFWRFSYNFGIGWLLNQQSNNNRLVNWSIKSRVFSNDNNSLLSRFIKLEIKSQMNKDYSISKYPIEFNTWLIFRKVVDLILMLDFTTFICLVFACSINNNYQFINDQSSWLINSRLIIGVVLILFNLWVKINAHNTIKDYAWYWGDFFFRQINNEELIFDGVFEMVPHPMYSVGYIGYYGFALISKSYTVLVTALFGHFLQMIFLHFIENPHIDKIYGPSENESDIGKIIKLKDLKNFDNLKPLVGLWNFNLFRATDLTNLILVITYSVFIPLIANFAVINFKIWKFEFDTYNILFVICLSFKIFESLLIDILLILQSYYKTFTKWYLSNNIPVSKSLNNWSIIYNSLINLTYSSFVGLNVLNFINPTEFSELYFTEYLYLRIFLGILLIATQIWINSSIIDSIGYFGWFYGDFFIPKTSLLPQRSNLTKVGVYRYLNNPEQIFGVCGVIGVTLIVPNFENLVISLVWVINNFVRINFIEKLHMIKVYGEQEVLKDSGVTKTFKKHLIPDLIQRRLSNNNDEFSGKRKNSLITDTIDTFIRDLNNLNNRGHNNMSNQNLLELSQSLYFEKSNYSIKFINLQHDEHYFTSIGNPIEIEFESPDNHSPKDWIGLYKIIQTSYSRYKTLILSHGRWDWIGEENEGVKVFAGNKLFWEEGVYEFRYHLDGKHDVAFISQPFEIKSYRIDVPSNEDQEEVETFAKELKAQIFDKVLNKIDSIDTTLNSELFESNNSVIDNYTKISLLISKSTGIKINSKFLIYYDSENSGSKSGFTIKELGVKLIEIKKILNDLSHEEISLTKKNE